MKERPILFSAPMVRALLAGTKTQTRRIVKAGHEAPANICTEATWNLQKAHPDMAVPPFRFLNGDGRAFALLCPYGKPGDRLWVREAFSGPWCMQSQDGCAAVPPSKWGEGSRIWYWADGDPTYGDWTRPRPSIHMPRWASRILLEVTGVRVERLQAISEADAEAEGVEEWSRGSMSPDGHDAYGPQYKFELLWSSINGRESWDANPWVWVVEFGRTTP